MIIVKLNGGLGNQLFQYALGRKLALERGVELRFDLSALEADSSYRQYRLNHFHIQGRPTSSQELERFYFLQKKRLVNHIYAIFQRCLPYYRRRIVVEQSQVFDPNIFNVPARVSLQGYWQSEKYFKDIEDVLRQELVVKVPLNEVNKEQLHLILDSESVSLHIRRGDYVSNPTANNVLGVCSIEYYQKCIQLIAEKIPHTHFFVFSDDIEWAKLNLRIDYPVMFIDHNSVEQDYDDFRLMQACKHHIIANSSFSWWAAWLSSSSSKIVFAPRRWFNDISYYDRDIVPSNWVRV